MLSVYDYKILNFIGSLEEVSLSDIEKCCHRISAVSSRISTLKKEGLIADRLSETANDYENPPRPLGIYHITPDGRRALQDYKNVNIYSKLKTLASVLTLIASIIAAVAAVISALR